MVAYSFHTRFAPDVQAGLKTHTMRNPRKRHARVGENLQLFCLMRRPECFKIIPDPICTFVIPVIIVVSPKGIRSMQWTDEVAGQIEHSAIFDCEIEKFAQSDGFSGLNDMSDFWIKHHGIGIHRQFAISWGAHPFEGLLK